MNPGQKLEKAARRLRDAYGGTAVPPMRDLLDPADVENAYAIQAINTRFWQQQGRRIVGRKIGLTSKAVQKQLGVDRPDFGVLFDDMQIPNEGELSFARLIQGKAEAEVALILGRDLDKADATPDDVIAASESAAAAIEVVDSRIADWKISFADTVADNGSSAFFILGENRVSPCEIDLKACTMALMVDGDIASAGTGDACLGDPLIAAAWLARTLAQRGEPLRAGDILLTGALGPMVPLSPGTRVEATISGLGDVAFQTTRESGWPG